MPLPFDLIVEPAYWDAESTHVGDACCFSGCARGQSWRTELEDRGEPSRANIPPCTGITVNGGFWVFSPSPVGKLLLDLWVAAMFQEYWVSGKLQLGTVQMDYQLVGREYTIPLYHWHETSATYVPNNVLHRGTSKARIFRLSAQRLQNRCYSICGMLGPNMGHSHYIQGGRLVCVMPRKMYDRVIMMHQNCCTDYDEKLRVMKLLGPGNWTYNETRYLEEAKIPRHIWGNPAHNISDTDVLPVVDPDW